MNRWVVSNCRRSPEPNRNLYVLEAIVLNWVMIGVEAYFISNFNNYVICYILVLNKQ